MKKLCVVFAMLLLCVNVVYSMTLADMFLEVRRLVRDTNGLRWTNSELTARCNEIQDEIASLTFCISTVTYVTTVALTREYSLPNDCMAIQRISYLVATTTGYYQPIENISVSKLDVDGSQWEYDATGGDPLNWYETRHKIGLDPVPSYAYARAAALRVEYFKKPDSLVSTTTTGIPFDGIQQLYAFHNLITQGVAYLCLMDDQNFTAASAMQAMYFQGIKNMIFFLDNKPARRGHIEVMK